MKFTPKPNQRVLIAHGIERKLSAWFVGMGLGKTAARLAVWNHLFFDGQLKGVLVVAPLRVAVLTWPDEIKKWDDFSWLRVANLRTKEGKQAWQDGAADIYLINYEALPRFSEEFLKGKKASEIPVNEVFFDESDNAKSHSSKRINTFRKWGRAKFERCGIQTGTFFSNSRLGIFSQIRLLDCGERWKTPSNPNGTSYTSWRDQYFEVENPFADYPRFKLREGSQGLIENKIADVALVQRTEEHADWLPPVEHDVAVKLPAKSARLYATVQKEYLQTLDDGFEILAANSGVLVNKLLQITSGAIYVIKDDDLKTRRVENLHGAKVAALKKLHKDNGNAPMLVACQFIHEVDRVLEAIPGAERFENDRLDAWNRGEIPMIVAHPKSIGHGLNMQQGSKLICWFSLGYSRALYDQWNGRLARTGQVEETQVFRLIAPGTVDDAIAHTLEVCKEDKNNFDATLADAIRRLSE